MIFLGFIGKIFGVDNFISPEINIFNSCLGTRLQTWLRRHQTASVLSTLAETAQDFKHMVYCTLSTQARNAQDLVVYTVRVHTNKYLVYYIIQTVHSKQYLSK